MHGGERPKPVPAPVAAMYQEALLAHYRKPHNRRRIAKATATVVRKNPLCGDEMSVQLVIDGDHVADIAFDGRGCSIAIASASIMTQAVRGLTKADALMVADGVDAMLGGASGLLLPDALTPLRGVAPFAARHPCATMAWMALRDALATK